MASARSASSAIWKFLVGILVALLVLLLVAEFGLRWFMGNELRNEFREQAAREGVELTEDPTVSFGTTPLILSATRGNIPEVEVTTPSTLQVTDQEIIGQPGTHVVLNDLQISDPDNPVAGRMVATTEVPDEYLLAVIQQSMEEENAGGLLQITGITSDAAAGTLNVQFNGGMAELNLSPTPVDGQLTFVATGASLFGFDLPGAITDMITAALREGVAEQAAGFSIEEFTVIEDGARMRVSGENVPLSEVGNPQLR